jgi:pantoate--beta-alanine ligase
MQVVTTVQEMQAVARQAHDAGQTIGCVPTMGSLHAGHASLIRHAAATHPFVVTSIFVNPTQFGPTEDFDKYPRNLERDIETVSAAGGTHIFAPSVDEMYPPGFTTTIHLRGIANKFEGTFRPGHFDGVATVVAKLLLAMAPDEAFFGQKDYQQTLVVRRMVRDLGIPSSIVVLPTMREPDGLAMSSRNVYLSPEDRMEATIIYAALCDGMEMAMRGFNDREALNKIMRTRLESIGRLDIDYVAAALADSLEEPEEFQTGDEVVLLVAAKLGTTRLIDNVLVRVGG